MVVIEDTDSTDDEALGIPMPSGPLPPLPGAEPVKTTYEAAPVIRDLRKEAAAFMPRNIVVQQKKAPEKKEEEKTVETKVVEAAPEVREEEEGEEEMGGGGRAGGGCAAEAEGCCSCTRTGSAAADNVVWEYV